MEHRCLVVTGRLLEGQDADAVQARMAQAFGMEMADFRKRVFERAPLIIRRGLDQDAANAQATQLRQLGVEADVLPDDAPLIWLLRDVTLRGPLPETALGRYARSGDQWCHDGGQQWFPWDVPTSRSSSLPPPIPEPADHPLPPPLPVEAQEIDGSLPPPLPDETVAFEPPPLPPARRPPVSRWAIAATCLAIVSLIWTTIAPVALVLALVCLLVLMRRKDIRGRGWSVTALVIALAGTGIHFMPAGPDPGKVAQQPAPRRPLQPLPAPAAAAPSKTSTSQVPVAAASTRAPAAASSAAAPVAHAAAPASPSTAATVVATPTRCTRENVQPHNDEDRFLLTGGQRLLTGRSQRKGDTYVAEAATGLDQACRPDDVQLYVFRRGVFVGTALEEAASKASARLADFELSDDLHLRINLAPCKAEICEAPIARQVELLHDAGGWVLKRP
ncbi:MULTISPECIES: hypothetical protein [Dyella]|uniref:DUF4190 domain-containing protein n=2 Tax=Dyella TaxID=231454 RepID=A0A4R0YNK8_9GAMM|nr:MULTISPECIES: hypothetical protein [Dyella]TBR36818.1 hypothetical protein EYV96_12985 [Dyella terrae]TCI08091.1 hypothetical protein EZM97_25885 [Dyella soli]